MSAEPVHPVPTTAQALDLEHEVIHLGGESAVVVPLTEYLQLRALRRSASIEALEDAEDMAALQESYAREATGTAVYLTRDEAWRRLGLEP